MSTKVTVDNLANAIMKELEEFKNVTEEACDKGVSETAKEALSKLHNAHPSGSGKYGSWDKYNKGWTVKKTKRDKTATIHNATDYQLTHLLEKGHALKGGGRAQAFPHIAPVAEECEAKLVQNIQKWI